MRVLIFFHKLYLTPFFHSYNISNMLNIFNIAMDTNPQFQNPNPNFDQLLTHTSSHHQFNDLLYLGDITNYLMSDEGLEGRVELLEDQKFSESFTNISDETSNHSVSSARNLKRSKRKVEKYYKAQDEFRFAFRTKSDLEFMDDGFKWRKYGKKMVKGSPNPRNYFKCSSGGCRVKKRVERDKEDPRYVITTYEGMHNHETPTCVVYCTQPTNSLFNTYSK